MKNYVVKIICTLLISFGIFIPLKFVKAINVISPAGGQTCTGGQVCLINWYEASANPVLVYLDLYMENGSLAQANIAGNYYPANSSYNWTIPAGLNGHYKIFFRDNHFNVGDPRGKVAESQVFNIDQPVAAIPAPTLTLTLNKTTINSGDLATLTWSSTNATTVVSSNFNASGVSGSVSVNPSTTTTYTLKVGGQSGQKESSVTLTVNPPTPSYKSSGSWVSKPIGNELTNSFNRFYPINEKVKSDSNEITYQFSSSTNNYLTWSEPVVANLSNCANGLITCINNKVSVDLSKIALLNNAKFIKVKINLSTNDPQNTPSLDGFNIDYTIRVVSQDVPAPTTPPVNPEPIVTSPSNNSVKTFNFQFSNLVSSNEHIAYKLYNKGGSLSEQKSLLVDSKGKYQNLEVAKPSYPVNLYAKAPKQLSKKILIASESVTDVDFGQLLTGDLNNDDIINSMDFSLINKYWNQANDLADLNKDGFINSLDFSVLNKNWGKSGDALTDNISDLKFNL
jgi:hypothetical protein